MKTEVLFTVSILFFSLFTTNVHADEMDNYVACAGVVVGNSAADYVLGNKEQAHAGFEVAYTAYLSQIFANSYSQSELKIFDAIFASNTDKIINAVNAQVFDENTYEEVLRCTVMLGALLIKNRDVVVNHYKKIKTKSEEKTAIIIRLLEAGG